MDPVNVVPDGTADTGFPGFTAFRRPQSEKSQPGAAGDAPLFHATKHEVNRATADRRRGARDLQLVVGDDRFITVLVVH